MKIQVTKLEQNLTCRVRNLAMQKLVFSTRVSLKNGHDRVIFQISYRTINSEKGFK